MRKDVVGTTLAGQMIGNVEVVKEKKARRNTDFSLALVGLRIDVRFQRNYGTGHREPGQQRMEMATRHRDPFFSGSQWVKKKWESDFNVQFGKTRTWEDTVRRADRHGEALF